MHYQLSKTHEREIDRHMIRFKYLNSLQFYMSHSTCRPNLKLRFFQRCVSITLDYRIYFAEMIQIVARSITVNTKLVCIHINGQPVIILDILISVWCVCVCMCMCVCVYVYTWNSIRKCRNFCSGFGKFVCITCSV